MSYGFSLLPTRFELGVSQQATRSCDIHQKERDEEEKTYSICVKEYDNAAEGGCNRFTNSYPFISLSYEPIYLYKRLGIQFQLFRRKFDKLIYEFPKEEFETKLNYEVISLGLTLFIAIGDKSLGKSVKNNWSFILGLGSQQNLINDITLTNNKGSIKPQHIKNIQQ